jgi:hypothetical protein
MLILLILLFALHAMIHVVGFLKWWKLAPVSQISGHTLVPLSEVTGRLFGSVWLVALVLLLAAAVLRIKRHDAWWRMALFGVGLSQSLIILAWADAKFGTIANVLILIPVVVAGAHARFSRRIDGEVQTLFTRQSKVRPPVVQREELDRLPLPVKEWLESCGAVGLERAHTVRLTQRGDLRTGPNQPFMHARAQQYFGVDEPGFIWKVETTMMKIIPITGCDRYFGGEGETLIKVASLVNVADGKDEKIVLGAMLRFLGEIVWFPSAALSSYIDWESMDETHAKATMRHGGREVSAEFAFDQRGRVTSIRADRYFQGGPEAKLTPWVVHMTTWHVMRGVEVPVRGNVVWKLPSGDFEFYQWEILDIETNRRELYPALQA